MKPAKLKLARAGYFLIAVAVIFFGSMMFLAPKSTDPVELMRIAGQASGAVGGVGIALVIIGSPETLMGRGYRVPAIGLRPQHL